MQETKRQLCLRQLSILLIVSSMLLVAIIYVPTQSVTLNLVHTFGISSGAAALVANVVDGGATASTIITVVGGIATGGVGLIAAAGRQALVTYLKSELSRRGRKAFIAW